jgi:xylulokinase
MLANSIRGGIIMRYVMGIDVSTTGAKALLVNEAGDVICAVNTPLTLSTPRPLWSEQDPKEWWSATVTSIAGALERSGVRASDVLAIGLTGQMHGLTLLDRDGNVLRPAILWNDQRTGQQCDAIRARVGKSRLIAITGNDALAGFTAPKILWVRENEPEVYARVRHILLPKDYVRYCLTGTFATDKADAAGTLLLDLKTRAWSAEILEALEIPADWLPETFEGPQVTGAVTPQAAGETGLLAGTPVVAGGGDQSAQAVGVGAIRPGVVALTLGTSGVVFVSTEAPVYEPEGLLHAFCHAVPGRWHLMGVMLSAAGSLRWYHDTFAPASDYDELLAEAAEIPAGCEGLFFLPYLTGERTPHPDPLARGAFIGLTIRHGLVHMTRAVLEGVAFGLRDIFELIRQVGVAAMEEVRVSGGGSRSPVWRQILADVLGVELVTVNTTEGAAYGAALLAGVGAGIWPDVEAACRATISVTGKTAVDAEQHQRYERYYPAYRQLYPLLAPWFHALEH